MARILPTVTACLRWIGQRGATATAETVMGAMGPRLAVVSLRAKLARLEQELYDVEHAHPQLGPTDTRYLPAREGRAVREEAPVLEDDPVRWITLIGPGESHRDGLALRGFDFAEGPTPGSNGKSHPAMGSANSIGL